MGNTRSATTAAGDDARKSYRTGTHRTVAPRETLARVRPLLAPMGITRIANVTGLDRLGIPVVMAVRPNSRSVAVAQGKGLDLDAAKASAVMEAIETWHGETISLPLKLASYEELRWQHTLLEPAHLPMPADSRYHDHHQLLWIEGRDLRNGTPVWVPYELVHTNYASPAPPGSGCFVANTNGLASGNHPLEAILHGLCEVVERDATTLWSLSPQAERDRRRVDPASIDDPGCRSLLERFHAASVDVCIWDITTDVKIPSFLCLVSCSDTRPGEADEADPEFGAGCHPAAEIALLRALTEAAQARTTFIAGSRDDMGWPLYAADTRLRRREAAAALAAGRPARPFSAAAGWRSETLAEDVNEALARLARAGLDQVVVVDLSKPVFRIPVVRVVIPGLEGALEDPAAGGEAVLPGPRAQALLMGEG
jgi:YcaO-like protein with predicted kinase domain